MKEEAIIGCLLGTAVGDALGLPYEGLSPRRAAKLLGPPDRHRFLFGHGMISDDTEHTCMVAQSLINARGDVARFRRALAWRFRWWLLCLPAGIGRATLRAILKLWCGFPSMHSGVFSAGNGPSMRAAILGVAIDDLNQLREFVTVSTRITHTDPKAEYGAFAVALAAHVATQAKGVNPRAYRDLLGEYLVEESSEFLSLVDQAVQSQANGQTTQDFAIERNLECGVSGYTYHTVPVVLHAWFSHPHDYQAAIMSVIACGGDADTTAAILGGIIGGSVGKQGIPNDWRNRIAEWPRGIRWIENLGKSLADPASTDSKSTPLNLFIPLRNLLFLFIVLYHGSRRLLPPY